MSFNKARDEDSSVDNVNFNDDIVDILTAR